MKKQKQKHTAPGISAPAKREKRKAKSAAARRPRKMGENGGKMTPLSLSPSRRQSPGLHTLFPNFEFRISNFLNSPTLTLNSQHSYSPILLFSYSPTPIITLASPIFLHYWLTFSASSLLLIISYYTLYLIPYIL